MIISASRRTDIPAFHGDWFMSRIREGYFMRINPFNSRQVSRISLKPEDVAAICFWTKDPRPFMRHLDELDRMGYRYYFQCTLNPYDRVFEPHVPPLDERVATMRTLAQRIGPKRLVWRLDPIILSSVTPVGWHLEQAEKLAGQLSGSTTRLMFSFLDFYAKSRKRMELLRKNAGITLNDIVNPEHEQELLQLVRGLKQIADRHGMAIYSCAEEIDLSHLGIEHGACIDGNLIRELCEAHHKFSRDRNQRGACRCAQSVDMGRYDTCSFECLYCYANR